MTFAALLFPPRCAGCNALTLGDALCDACAESLVELGPACPRCAEPRAAPPSLVCARCHRHGLRTSAIHAPWRYGGALAEAIRRLKFHRASWVARTIAPLVAPYLLAVVEVGAVDVIVPVPLHWTRRLRRGYDQTSALLAAASPTTVPTVHALRRVRGGPPQSELGASDRRTNVRGAFTTSTRANVAGQRILVFDDIVTTGATMDAAAHVLLAAGAREVIGFAVARAEP